MYRDTVIHMPSVMYIFIITVKEMDKAYAAYAPLFGFLLLFMLLTNECFDLPCDDGK